jgi:branched-chain amino acid transport system substrate-binding protein
MSSIGVLLAGSTLYPSVGIDFLQGIKSCLSFHDSAEIQVSAFPIGYGIDEKEIYRQAEKFLLSDNVDAVVLYADDRHADMLSPLFMAAGKLLIVVNAGANYPVASNHHDHTLFHSMNDNVHSLLTGRLCAMESTGKTASLATSYYDGGYHHCHAMADSFARNGGEIRYNFVSHHKKEVFTTQPLAAFITANPSVKDLLCLYCGDMARLFYKELITLQQQFELRLYGSPMMFDITPGDFAEPEPSVPAIKGYTGWIPSLNNQHNRDFIGHFEKETGKKANLFALQGWETALLLLEYLQLQSRGMNTAAAIDEMKNKPRNSPRGSLRIHPTHTVLGPAYLVNANGQMEITVIDCIEDISPAFLEMRTYIPDTVFSTWRNTYLCI